MSHQPVMPVFISWNTRRWMPVGLGSFRKHFPSWQVLVIDNNPERGAAGWNEDHEAERIWLQSQSGVIVIKHAGPVRTHGAAVDTAVQWCRQNKVSYMLHLEPDCLISGTRWYEKLCRGIDTGAWMSGSHRKEYGPIHPTPSLWRVDKIQTSFDYASRIPDEDHPLFHKLFRRAWLLEAITNARQDLQFWTTTWDSAQKAWFQFAVEGKAYHAEETDDFKHFWAGSNKAISERHFQKNPELGRFTEAALPPRRTMPLGTPVSAVANSIRSLLVQALRETGIRTAIYAGTPRHANTGDSLLMLGQRAAIESAGIEIVETVPWTGSPSGKIEADAVLLHGGGNLGDLYRHETDYRLQICRDRRFKRVIWLPQSMEYLNSDTARSDMSELAALDHVEVWLRDAVSLSKAMSFGLRRVRLVPDGVFGLPCSPASFSDSGERFVIRRIDGESQASGVSLDDDWMLPGCCMPHFEMEAWDLIARRFRDTRMVITDRLHVHLLCVLSDIPNVLVADRYGKNRAMYFTWTHLHRFSRFAAGWDEVGRSEKALETLTSAGRDS